jgi:methylmalonyl-CoA mutase
VVWLAGRPAKLEGTLREAGVSGFIFAGCDALSALREAHAIIES